MDRRTISPYYAELGKQVIETYPELEYLRNAPIKIVYLGSEHKKKRKNGKILGECEKVQEKNKWGIPADFTITIFEPNVEGLTEDQIKILLYHELLHIGKDYNSINPHDLEDFKSIISQFGVDWNEVKE